MIHVLKRLLAFLAIGGVLGDVLTMLIAPGFVTWFHTPVGNSALCNCEENAKATAAALIDAQLVGFCIGALAFTIIAELVTRLLAAHRAKKAQAQAAPAAATPQ
jgi:hypothetical protein